MTVTMHSPEGMFQPVPYHHVSVASGTPHVHVAGQIARDGEGNRLAPGDLKEQTAIALRNTARGLAGAGADFSDVVRLRFFAVQWHPDKMGDFLAGIDSVVEELNLPQPLPPLSFIGVDYLFEPDVLIEVEAYAVLD
ncbi:Endoribonuclease L-PSP [Arthrobacter saudimassiliensis]|uniref:Endoribonuclease L-PSP n=1 Tax=Arthrobacter saudimassiliensis TaxID=1461584 RepID=A0A078MIJ5_9MICC|nr:Endoribonuclease L-PSP [Arthrobacter saudimassiliensis]